MTMKRILIKENIIKLWAIFLEIAKSSKKHFMHNFNFIKNTNIVEHY